MANKNHDEHVLSAHSALNTLAKCSHNVSDTHRLIRVLYLPWLLGIRQYLYRDRLLTFEVAYNTSVLACQKSKQSGVTNLFLYKHWVMWPQNGFFPIS
jgi:hypothetical protein